MDDKPRFLITTADERSWRTGVPTLCLGEWCHLYGRSAEWERLDAAVAPYHWDDREQLYEDYIRLGVLHETLLRELAAALNAAHGVRHSVRYWRILVGPWLQYFTQMLFDRWTMIQRAVRDYTISGTAVLAFSPDQIVPRDMVDFRNLYPGDAWNHAMYARIIEGWTDVPRELVAVDAREAIAHPVIPHATAGALTRISRTAAAWVSGLLERAGKASDALLISTFMSLKYEYLLQLALGQIPRRPEIVPGPAAPVNPAFRARLRLDSSSETGFGECVRALIPEQIPTVYLEGYKLLVDEAERLRWPVRPRVIFTANCYLSCEVFKEWAASKVESGTPLVIGQHGGNLGSARWSSSEDHELAIADRYVTWGWSDGNPKQYPVGVLNRSGRNGPTWNSRGHLLLVTSVLPRYSYVLGGYPAAASQTQAFLEDQYAFVRALPKRIYDDAVIRLFRPDWGWFQAQRWRDQFPDGTIDSGEKPMQPLVSGARLCVSTYNATAFLQSLSRNNPTIVFWNPRHWELRPSAEPYFALLREAGIFHHTPEAAALKATEVWDDVAAWWSSPEVQAARRHFCDRFARTLPDPIRQMRRALLTTSGTDA